MEEIKCPGCGSGKVRKITEEKYECLACDNLFLIHSLSKEFRQTDEHIEKIHQDLKESMFNSLNPEYVYIEVDGYQLPKKVEIESDKKEIA